MDRIAFVFSGQGDQYPGMGKELYEKHKSAARVLKLCEQLRPGTLRQCFEGTEEELRKTGNTQPCLFAVELAVTAVLEDRGIHPAAVAGFSLGEVTAATAAGIFDLKTGFRLVCARGRLMEEAAEKFDTSMAAVVKLPAEKVIELSEHYPDVYPVNFNAPGQTSVSGLSAQMKEFSKEVKAAGGRAIPLKVQGAFHSPFMKEAAASFEKELFKVSLQRPQIPLYSNVTAEAYGEDVRGLLSRQISSPVQWETLIRNMIRDGIDTFIEIGPGHTLTNLIGKIQPEVKTTSLVELKLS
ncbi:MAG: ACP S-malonyltransferase [Lachnospiraceae bacterium]|jgi:[acyl-carrier-protein] S-malonyltransferase|nr:ACP S-malonyltransferase [Lachnospiraceae bacterium]